MTSTATTLSRDPSRAPRFGWRTVGAIAATTLGSGPVLVLWFTLVIALTRPEIIVVNVVRDPAGFAVTLGESVLYGSVASLPATLVHAVTVGVLAHRTRDAFGWSLTSGAMLGVLLAASLIWILVLSGEMGGFEFLEGQLLFLAAIAAPFAATGASMGLLYWRIAVRPRRRWRLLRQHSDDAIRAME